MLSSQSVYVLGPLHLMVQPAPQLPLEQTVTCFKSVAAARLLEPTAADAAALARQATTLLSAISATAFRLPEPVAISPPAPRQAQPPVDYNQPLPQPPTGVFGTTADEPAEGDVIFRTL
jgi:hypothetical protein